jgi:hypothetical protein
MFFNTTNNSAVQFYCLYNLNLLISGYSKSMVGRMLENEINIVSTSLDITANAPEVRNGEETNPIVKT